MRADSQLERRTTSSRAGVDLERRVAREECGSFVWAICGDRCSAGVELCSRGAEAGSARRGSAAVAAGESQDDEGRAARVSPGGCDINCGWSMFAGVV